jgi:hypothetical protein
MTILRAPSLSKFKTIVTAVLTAALVGASVIAVAPAQAAMPTSVDCSITGKIFIGETDAASISVVRNEGCAGAVAVPNGVEAIGDNAFYNTPNLTLIELPASVVSIGNRAFSRAEHLSEVIFAAGSSLTTIGESAFAGATHLTSIQLPDDLFAIGTRAFKGSGLVSIRLPADVQFFGDGFNENLEASPFYGALALISITVDPANMWFESVNGVLFDETLSKLLVYPAASGRTTYTIPESVQGVWSWSFANATKLKRLMIPASLRFVGVKAFENTASMEEFNVTWDQASGAQPGRYLSHALQNDVDILQGALYDFAGYATSEQTVSLVAYPSAKATDTYSIPGPIASTGASRDFSGITGISADAFAGAKKLKTLNIPASVREIQPDAFYDIPTLENLNVSSDSSTYSTGDGVLFNKAKTTLIAYPTGSLRTSYDIPTSVGVIATAAFALNTNLQAVNISEAVTEIKESAFYGASKLANFKFLTQNAPTGANIGEEAFSGVATNAIIRVKPGAGFGAYGSLWNSLIVATEYAQSGSSPSAPMATIPQLPPVVEMPKTLSKLVNLRQILLRVSANGVPVLSGTSASAPIVFPQNSAQLDSADLVLIKKIHTAFLGKKGTLVLVGFTKGSKATTAKDRQVALARAKAVSAALTKLGGGLSIEYVGYGVRAKSKPSASDNRVDVRWVPSK